MSDAALERLCSLSHLSFSAAEAERVRKDVAAVLSAAQVLQEALQARKAQGLPLPGGLQAELDSLSEEQLEAAAEASWARLRPDAVTEACSPKELLAHAQQAEGSFFVTPKVVEE